MLRPDLCLLPRRAVDAALTLLVAARYADSEDSTEEPPN